MMSLTIEKLCLASRCFSCGCKNVESFFILITLKNDIVSICLSLTGLINDKGLWNPINKNTLGNFENYPIVNVFRNSFNVPVYALGDTQAAALGEM